MICHNDDCPPQLNLAPERDVASDRQMIELQDIRNALEPREEVIDFLEMIAELDERDGVEHAFRIHDKLAMVERIQIRGHEEQIRGGLDGQEAGPGHVDSVRALKVLDSSADGGLELQNLFARVGGLIVDDDLKIHSGFVENAFNGAQVDPQVVGVKNLELLDRLEVLHVLRGHLRDLEKPDLTLVVNKGATLDVSLGLVRHLHDELGVRLHHVIQDVGVHRRAKIVHV
ncbi:hypothetical protein BC938DRAFT_477312 [Jimgerdemannia flammicorona]|uniref:Uncharacterized protein n=1 Tax=Jimgerdemannia flammicorona TaxID=994334 RepID=A0A433PAG7_9FUNG|nr:hypothetical protein BC938DRAFT_477312 [Jimgerdemannia flammicorona]